MAKTHYTDVPRSRLSATQTACGGSSGLRLPKEKVKRAGPERVHGKTMGMRRISPPATSLAEDTAWTAL